MTVAGMLPSERPVEQIKCLHHPATADHPRTHDGGEVDGLLETKDGYFAFVLSKDPGIRVPGDGSTAVNASCVLICSHPKLPDLRSIPAHMHVFDHSGGRPPPGKPSGGRGNALSPPKPSGGSGTGPPGAAKSGPPVPIIRISEPMCETVDSATMVPTSEPPV